MTFLIGVAGRFFARGVHPTENGPRSMFADTDVDHTDANLLAVADLGLAVHLVARVRHINREEECVFHAIADTVPL
ncbi:hypothetical protein [Roseateles sp. LYH14W]|uniref:Uncharacterized protein n=1 Tax=Pelomonas parva TaxID=3299032 RepID=A0ABW7FBI7_9BURK